MHLTRDEKRTLYWKASIIPVLAPDIDKAGCLSHLQAKGLLDDFFCLTPTGTKYLDDQVLKQNEQTAPNRSQIFTASK